MRIDHFQRSRERRTLPLPGRLCSIPADGDDFAGVDEEIHHAVEICASIEDASTANQNAHACSPPSPQPSPGRKTAMATAPLTTLVPQSGGTAAPYGERRHWQPGQESMSRGLPPPPERSQHHD